MAEISTSTPDTSAPLDARVALLREKLHSSSQGRKMMQDLAPAGMVRTAHNAVDFASRDIVDFTDWQQWSQWPQSY